jgi:predicted CXXCH cytochrome family protein
MPASKSQPNKERRRKWPWLLVIAIPVALVVLGAGSGVVAMQLENHDDFCASCHSEPESTYVQRETAVPTDLASFHKSKEVRCIDCHSGPGLMPGRMNSLMLGAKDLVAWMLGHATQPAVHTRPIEDANCLKCHANVTTQQDFNNHFHVFLARWQARDPKAATCASCHQAHHTEGEEQLKFLNRDATVQVCQACHAVLRGD